MSTSLLYHAFCIKDYIYSKTEYKKDKVIITTAHNPGSLKCPGCGSKEITLRGRKKGFFRTVPIRKKMVFIQLRIQRVMGHSYGKVRQVAIGFADPLLSYTISFDRYANDFSQHMSILDVARHLGVSWDIKSKISRSGI